MKTASPKLETAFLTANDEALLRCETALELRDKGDYEGVREIMLPIWKRVGDHPDVEGFDPPVVAEVLTLLRTYEQASASMPQMPNRKLQWRVIDAAKKVMANLWGEMDSDRALEILLARPPSSHVKMLRYEGALIKQRDS